MNVLDIEGVCKIYGEKENEVKALVNMFSREIPAELEFKQIEKID